jgi:hypothetical protein
VPCREINGAVLTKECGSIVTLLARRLRVEV